HIQPRVASEDVAELVRDDPLDLVAVQKLERAACNRHRNIAACVACSEGVDASLLIENINLRHWCAGGYSHFFDHVAQFLFVGLRRIRFKTPTAQQRSDRLTSCGELADLVKTARGNAQPCDNCETRSELWLPYPSQAIARMEDYLPHQPEDRKNERKFPRSMR